jgi:hypothetical protein
MVLGFLNEDSEVSKWIAANAEYYTAVGKVIQNRLFGQIGKQFSDLQELLPVLKHENDLREVCNKILSNPIHVSEMVDFRAYDQSGKKIVAQQVIDFLDKKETMPLDVFKASLFIEKHGLWKKASQSGRENLKPRWSKQ